MKKSLIALGLLIFLVACASCIKETVTTAAARSNTPANASPEPSARVATPPMPQVAKQESEAAYTTSAPIVVENQVDVLAQREGMIDNIRADIGQHVRKGDVLATLDSKQLQAERASLEHTLRATEQERKFHEAEESANQSDLERAEKMFAAGLNTKEQLDHARFYYEATKFQIAHEHEIEQQTAEQIRSKDLEIAKMRIVAPFSGVVARRYVRLGQKVSPSDRLFWITEVAPLRVRFTVPQDAMRSVKKGTTVDLQVPAADSKHYTAKVIALSPVVDPSSGTVEVVAELVGRVDRLCPGMTATVSVPSDSTVQAAVVHR
ncbi:MAG TPA: efflux RND transporter periplasmic adaptor subunit [candidate division Zixibacteria bacterium]|nr:efflux RND transporter periplasmic adaptor subunit [candidate division Zixibacteria bacterium]